MATKSSGGGDGKGSTKPAKLRVKVSGRSGESGSAQVARQLRGLITSGSLAAGEALPSEDKLAEQIGVGRKVVRSAYGALVGEGLLVKDHPRPKRVAGKKGKAAPAEKRGASKAATAKGGGKRGGKQGPEGQGPARR